MDFFVLGLTALAGVSALDIKVANTGGNATSGKQYGIMFEVVSSKAMEIGEPDTPT